jgi:sulfur transfer complex TusBCD TusB component (DsrH family)
LSPILEAAIELQAFCRSQGWRFCFIGGVAIQRWGNPRFTQAIDLTLLTGFGSEEEFVDGLLQELSPRRQDARDFALAHRVLLARTPAGIDVDIALGALPFEERTVHRASAWQIRGDLALTTCSAEDLVTHKVFAGRNLDWGDVEQVLIRQHGRLNLAQVRRELGPLLELKGQPEAMAKLDVESVFGPIQAGDRFLLCSDGLTGVVTDREIAEHMIRAPLEAAAERLTDQALARGAPDNVSLVLIAAEPA